MSIPDPESSAGHRHNQQSPWADNSHDSYPSAAPQYVPLDEAQPSPAPSFRWLYAIATLLTVYWIYLILARYYATYKRRQDVLERRRRAGIPDEDMRPFDIAYSAAALRRRQETDEKMQLEQERARASQERNSDWALLGRAIGVPQDRYGSPRARNEGLLRRFPTAQLQHQQQPYATSYSSPLLDYTAGTQRQPSLQYRGGFVPVQPADSPTISSSDSPPRAPPPAWQDRYAPPEVKAAHNLQRQRATAPTSTLGRRSRKHLVLDDESELDAGSHDRSRRRLDKWGQEVAIDGDNEARWTGAQRVQNDGSSTNRIRKRGQEGEEETDDLESRAKSKRKTEPTVDDPTVPGEFKTSTAGGDDVPTSAIAGPGKRKARDDEEPTAGDPTKPLKQKKRVRVVSAHDVLGDGDQDMVDDGEAEEKQEPPVRRVGDEWTAEDGVKHKMGENGVELKEAFVKEQKNVLKPSNRFSPNKTLVYTVTKRWMSPDAYAKAEKAGLLSTEFDAEAILAEIKQPSRGGSDNGSDWGSIVGQTPLKTGGMKTGLGSDRPAPALPQSGKLAIEQSRLLHLTSPARKNIPYGKGGISLGRTNGPVSQWEKKKAEADALATLRSARRSKADLAKSAAGSGDATPPATTTSVSMPSLILPKPAVQPTLSAPTPVTGGFSFGAAAPSTTVTAPAPAPALVPTQSELPKRSPFAIPAPPAPQRAETPKSAEVPKPSFGGFAIPPVTLTTPAASTPAATAKTDAAPSSVTAATTTTAATAKPSPFGGFQMPSNVDVAAKPVTTPFNFGAAAQTNTSSSAPPKHPALFGDTLSTAPKPPVLFGGASDAAPKPPALFGGLSSTPSGSLFGVAQPSVSSTQAPVTSATAAPLNTTATPTNPTPTDPPKSGFSFGSGFGKPATSSAFTPSSLTAGPSTSPQNQTSSSAPAINMFGGNTETKPAASGFSFGGGGGGGAFGGSAVPKQDSPAPPSFGFGASAPSNNNGFGGFGSTKPATQNPAPTTGDKKPASQGFSILGAATKNAAVTNGMTEPPKIDASAPRPPMFGGFGQSPATAPSSFLGTNGTTTNTSANPPPTPLTNIFGSTANKPAPAFGGFGSGGGSTSVFGAGAAAATASPFGQAAPVSPFNFGATINGTNPADGNAAGGGTTPVAPVFNVGATPPPQNRPSKPLPRSRR